MARPIPWLSRLHEIRASVSQSVRSHYTRKELQALFEVQARTALRLLEIQETTKVGTALLVSKEELGRFLDRAKESDDVAALMEEMRRRKGSLTAARKKIRSLVARDVAEASFERLPGSLELERGRMTIRFDTAAELVSVLVTVATLLQDDPDEFARRYEPLREELADPDVDEVERMFRELEQMENRAAQKQPEAPRQPQSC